MPVRFAVHRVAEPAVERWFRRIATDPHGGPALAQTYFNAIRDELVRTAGQPTGAHFVGWVRPRLGLWEVQHGTTWVAYLFKSEGGF